jgi:DNA helicase-2/ATP-dependent DNA helicase PcrA
MRDPLRRDILKESLPIHMNFLDGLNPQQQQAVRHTEGPLLILAGAGSGKTRVVTHRISHLVDHHKVTPERILAVTFTNKAAAEMKERVAKLLAGKLPPGRSPYVFTFHSFCVRLLRRDGTPLSEWRPGFTREFLIYDDDDQLSLLKSLYKEHRIDDKAMPPRNVLSAISGAKNRGEGPSDMMKAARDPRSKQIAALFEQYNDGLIRANALDFDDLLLESANLLRRHQPTRENWNKRVDFLMIDEYQDTNRTQYEMARLLSHGKNNVCAVGDEDQSIYSWRGADIQNILDFERDFPNATVIRLEQNYRSTKNILEAASHVIKNNKERKGKWLWTESGAGPKITIYQAVDSENEALYIADQIESAMRTNADTRIAVLYRTNSQSRQIEEALRRYRLVYNVVGGLSFYQRAEIKDTLSYLKLILVPNDSVSLNRVINTPARGIGKTTVEQIEAYSREHKLPMWDALGQMLEKRMFPQRAEAAVAVFAKLIDQLRELSLTENVHQVMEALLERSGYLRMLKEDRTPGAESRVENINELLNAAAEAVERGEGLAEFLDHAALVAQTDQVDQQAKISLLTVHNAKGLEFPIVFLAGMEEGLFPHQRSFDQESMMEEERRLCYVGMTRAEQRLYITHALARRKYGGGPLEPAINSRFLKEIPPELCVFAGKTREQARHDDSEDWLEKRGFGRSGEVDLYSERSYVRQSASYTADRIKQQAFERRAPSAPTPPPPPAPVKPAPPKQNQQQTLFGNEPQQTYPGKTYNSVENIADFFRDRGIRPPVSTTPPKPVAPVVPIAPPPAPVQQQQPRKWGSGPVAGAGTGSGKRKFGEGSSVNHPKYGRGTVVRKEGDGEDAKLTIMFPGHGLKKIIAKFAGFTNE